MCMKANSRVQRYSKELCYTASNNPFEHLWQVDQVALVDPVHLEAQEGPWVRRPQCGPSFPVHTNTHIHWRWPTCHGTCALQRLSTLSWEIFVTGSCFVFVCACVDVKVDVTRFKLPVFVLPLYIYSLCTSLYLELEVKLRSHSSAAATYQLAAATYQCVNLEHLYPSCILYTDLKPLVPLSLSSRADL